VAVKIAPCPQFRRRGKKIVEVWRGAGSPKLIRMEGFDGKEKPGPTATTWRAPGAAQTAAPPTSVMNARRLMQAVI
jgi:hypothetical protein